MNSSVRVLLACCGSLATLLFSQPIAASDGDSPAPPEAHKALYQAHLERLDRELDHRRQWLEKRGADGAEREREAERFRRRLSFLESRIGGLESPVARSLLLRKLRAVERGAVTLKHAAGPRLDRFASLPVAVKSGPANDECATALPISIGTFIGDTTDATTDGEASCGTPSGPDVWFRYASPEPAHVRFSTAGSDFDTVLSVHSSCPGTVQNELVCNDDFLGLQSSVELHAEAETDIWIRAAGFNQASGALQLEVIVGNSLSGRVTEAGTEEPIPGIQVELFDTSGLFVASAETGAAGDYTLGGLLPGTYFAQAGFMSEYVTQIYDRFECPYGTCSVIDGTPIDLVSENVTDIDFSLERGGLVTGEVTGTQDGAPVEGVEVQLWTCEGSLLAHGVTEASGHYEIRGLATGFYFARTVNFFGFQDEIYDDLPCPVDCDPTIGAHVEVTAGQTTPDIDFALERLGAIAGRVTEEVTGEPIAFISINVLDAQGTSTAFGFTDETGHYEAGGLAPGNYLVQTADFFEYQDELYDDHPCTAAACDLETADPVAVEINTTTTGIDFALDRLGKLSGRVTDAAIGEPISTLIDVFDAAGAPVDFTTSDAEGRYLTLGLPPGTYFARTAAEGSGYLDELFSELPCPRSSCKPLAGTPIASKLNMTTSDIDFTLDLGGAVSGRVMSALTGDPGVFVNVEVWSEQGELASSGTTDEAGRYTVGGLEPGTYFVKTETHGSYVDEVWDDITCGPGCDPTIGNPVIVELGTATGGIDFALIPLIPVCQPSPSALCLNGGRFRVEAAWEDFDGNRGQGRGIELLGDSGTFYFFAGENIELLVKVLDACVAPFNRFWVFAAGLTNVGVELTVTDTLTGDVRTYRNPLGAAFEPIQDTDAFATCAAGGGGPGSGRFDGPRPRGTYPPIPTGDCLPSATALCLNDGRFQVEANWRTPRDETGLGMAAGLTADTGYFWFFDPDNAEMVVKVIDACGDPFDRFWVFAAGLTNVEVTLRVTDTATDEVREYRNPQGVAFEPVQDTDAFATCP